MRDLKWKMLSSEYIFADRWFKARADRCEFPDGRIIEPYYVVELPDWCNMIVVTKEERIILVRQYRYPVDQTTYELPGGIIENEQPLEAAKREMEEETGTHRMISSSYYKRPLILLSIIILLTFSCQKCSANCFRKSGLL